jgi:hypothetical protein
MAKTTNKSIKRSNISKGVSVSLEINKEKVISFKANDYESMSEINSALNGLLRIVGGVLVSAALHVMQKEQMEPSLEKLKMVFEKLSGKFFDSVVDYMNESIDQIYGEHFKNKDEDETETQSDTTGKA